ncbi:hypothetical protein Aglo03_51710 [Actinokineospora globicatena]|uniref:Uncharacterized protein n=1 Tax=Actinokineospora globicatena TaxID=103729 RepID=A0A9W6V8U1_9PSEU|nr:hypothetical protein Aglo03_51710 [Actinokineospora globicatena]
MRGVHNRVDLVRHKPFRQLRRSTEPADPHLADRQPGIADPSGQRGHHGVVLAGFQGGRERTCLPCSAQDQDLHGRSRSAE